MTISLVAFMAPAIGQERATRTDADASPVVDRPFKLSMGAYAYSDNTVGKDLNLRWEQGRTHAWLGYYTDPSFGHQTRAGFDHTFVLAPAALMQVSLQAANQGFFGGSVLFVLGDPWFVVAGLGRTNLHPYFNLNFDPNDAITAGFGWKGQGDTALAMTVVADDRLGTGQRVWHVFGRTRLADTMRVTVDVNYKTGEGDSGPVHGWGASATLDFPRWFIRLARDQKQNFTALDATRLSVGTRF
jgi:hypothetical protein